MVKIEHIEGKDKGKILLYSLSTCIWCRKTKELLERLGVSYDYIFVDLLDDDLLTLLDGHLVVLRVRLGVRGDDDVVEVDLRDVVLAHEIAFDLCLRRGVDLGNRRRHHSHGKKQRESHGQ